MSESSGFPDVPVSRARAEARRVAGAERVLRASLEQAPNNLEGRTERVKIRGEVVAANRDGTTRIRTDQGEVTVRVPDNTRQPPQRGQRVEIDIPPRAQDAGPRSGAPAARSEEVIIRTLPKSRETPVETRERPALDVRINPPREIQDGRQTERAQPALPPPPPGTEIRLQPLPPALAEQVRIPEIRPAPQQQLSAQALPRSTLEAIPAPLLPQQELPPVLRTIAADQPILRAALQSLQSLNIQSLLSLQPALPDITTFLSGDGSNQPAVPQNRALPSPLFQFLQAFEGPRLDAPTLRTIPQNRPPVLIVTPGQAPETAQPVQPQAGQSQNILQTQVSLAPPQISQNVFKPVSAQAPVVAWQTITPNLISTASSLSQTTQTPPVTGQTQIGSVQSVLNSSISFAANPGEEGAITQTQNPVFQGLVPGQHTQAGDTQLQNTTPNTQATLQNTELRAFQMPAIVTGFMEGGLPVLSVWPDAILSGQNLGQAQNFIAHLPPGTSLEQGAQVTLTPVSPGAISPGAEALPPLTATLAAPALFSPGPWPVMEQIQASLAQIAPQVAQSMTGMAPSPAAPQNVMPAALFFVAALRSGDLQSWLGEKAVETLRQAGKTNLLQRLTQEGGMLSRVAAEAPASQEWRGMALPLAHEGEIHKVILHSRHEPPEEDENNADNKGGKTRFVMDLDLSRMGKMQLDGLFQEGSRFDMVLRSEQSFAKPARNAMRTLYNNALEEAGLKGDLSFQNRPDQWVHISAATETFTARV